MPQEIRLLTPEVRILLTLLNKGPMGTMKLIDETGLARVTFYENIRKLLENGYVTRNDGLYEITEKGRRLLLKLAKELERARIVEVI